MTIFFEVKMKTMLTHMCRSESESTYSMLPELFDHAQAENVGYLCVHRETGGQDVSILIQRHRKELNK